MAIICYSIYFSTTSPEDLSKIQSPHFYILEGDKLQDEPALNLLTYDRRWFLGCRFGGCSCHFRHAQQDFGMGPVEDWFPEDPDDVESTRHAYDLFMGLTAAGYRLDVISWSDDLTELVGVIHAEHVPREDFRFLKGVKVVFASNVGH